MIHQMFIAKSGMFAYQRAMNSITNNISNAQTVGFKKSRVEFESLFPLIQEKAISEFEELQVPTSEKRRKYITYGQGVRIADVTKDFNQGTIEITNQPLDLAIEGQGFFQVRLPDGTVAFTRAGNLHQDVEGNVVNPNGHPLEPAIRIPRNTTEVVIDSEGRVLVRINNEATPREIGQVVLANFSNSEGLKELGQTLYLDTVASGEPVLGTPGRESYGNIRQRALEFSNVNIVEEMVRMLLTQRGFELIVKSFSVGDKMMTTASEIAR